MSFNSLITLVIFIPREMFRDTLELSITRMSTPVSVYRNLEAAETCQTMVFGVKKCKFQSQTMEQYT